VNPFYFGSSKRPLFGIHHPPTSADIRESGVVLCPPIGQDYMRTHRALKQLAQQLTKAGFHVLRFDYFGTGDSGGESVEADLEQWVANVGDAVEELKDTAGVGVVSLVGIRLGAALATVAASGRADIDRLVLWDPVVKGPAYVEELLQLGLPAGVNGSTPPGTIGVSGFPVTPTLRAGLEQIDLQAHEFPAKPVLLVVSDERPEYQSMRHHLSAAVPGSTFRLVPTDADWDDVDRMGAVLLPQRIIQEIVTYLRNDD
jgi:pimeloyl-ACP methyl ester carboxylesterase